MPRENNNISVYSENSTNIISDSLYKTLTDREEGALEGSIAKSNINNTALKQATLMASALAELIATYHTSETIGSGFTIDEMSILLKSTIDSYIPKDLNQLTNQAGYSKSVVSYGNTLPTGQALEDMKIGDIFILIEG